MRMNLLRMTQLILSGMDSDEVNSIGDTVESQQVVDVIEQTYNEIASNLDFPDYWDFFELVPSNDPSKPTLMSLPDNVAKLEYIHYDMSGGLSTKKEMRQVKELDRISFFTRMNTLDSSHADVYQYNLVVGTGTFDVRGYNDKQPLYYTTNNDRTLIFDNYDHTIDDTLMGNKTQCYGMFIPVFERSNDFIPELEPRQFSLLFNEAKSQAFIDLKQVENTKAERRARRGWNMAHRKTPNTPPGKIHHSYTPNFGRGGRC